MPQRQWGIDEWYEPIIAVGHQAVLFGLWERAPDGSSSVPSLWRVTLASN